MATRREELLENPSHFDRILYRTLTAAIVIGGIAATAWSLGPIFDYASRAVSLPATELATLAGRFTGSW